MKGAWCLCTSRADLAPKQIILLCALSTALLTLLGAAGESLGYDRMLKVNTVKTRTHSLLRQGAFYFQAIATIAPTGPAPSWTASPSSSPTRLGLLRLSG